MIKLKPIATIKAELHNTMIELGQLIYCTDTLEAFYDNKPNNRIAISVTRQFNSEKQIFAITNPKTTCIYVDKSHNTLYRYSQISGWRLLENYEDCADLIYNATALVPTVLTSNNVCRAPLTLSSLVFNNDGSTVQDTLDTLFEKGKQITLEKKTCHIILDYDGQRIVDIPFPESDYDIYKFPVVVILDNKYIAPEKYALGAEQLIFCDEVGATTREGQLVTFIFAYAKMNVDEGINADAIDGKHFNIGGHPPQNPSDGDIWMDTKNQIIWSWNGENNTWDIIFDNNAYTVQWQRNNVVLNHETTFVNIGINGFNKNTDKLIVFKNSTYLDEGIDYYISSDNSCISCKTGQSWDCKDNDVNYFSFIVFKNIPQVGTVTKPYQPPVNDDQGGNDSGNTNPGGGNINPGELNEINQTIQTLQSTILSLTQSIESIQRNISSCLTRLDVLESYHNNDNQQNATYIQVKNKLPLIVDKINTILQSICIIENPSNVEQYILPQITENNYIQLSQDVYNKAYDMQYSVIVQPTQNILLNQITITNSNCLSILDNLSNTLDIMLDLIEIEQPDNNSGINISDVQTKIPQYVDKINTIINGVVLKTNTTNIQEFNVPTITQSNYISIIQSVYNKAWELQNSIIIKPSQSKLLDSANVTTSNYKQLLPILSNALDIMVSACNIKNR